MNSSLDFLGYLMLKATSRLGQPPHLIQQYDIEPKHTISESQPFFLEKSSLIFINSFAERFNSSKTLSLLHLKLKVKEYPGLQQKVKAR